MIASRTSLWLRVVPGARRSGIVGRPSRHAVVEVAGVGLEEAEACLERAAVRR